MAVIALRDDVFLKCDISSVFDSIVWYKVSSDFLSQLPSDGTECNQTLTSGGGSNVNITGDIVENGNVYDISPVQFGDEGYYVCVVQTGGEQACFSNYVTVTGE